MKSTIGFYSALCILAGLSACGGGSGIPSSYNGSWNASFYDSAIFALAPSGTTLQCSSPTVTLTLTSGAGSAAQTWTCDALDNTTGATVLTLRQTYNISVAIGATSANPDPKTISAIVNGTNLTGTCISTLACSAQAGSGTSVATLSLTR